MNVSDISYIGIFTGTMPGTLDKVIPNQHVTLAFAPTHQQFMEILPYLGTEWGIHIKGYGNDGRNEGLLVNIDDVIPYFGAEKKHITLSIAEGAKAVDTGTLKFAYEIPDELKANIPELTTGVVAAFTKDRELIVDPRSFDEYNRGLNVLAYDLARMAILVESEMVYMQDLARCKFVLIDNGEPMHMSPEQLDKFFYEKVDLDGECADHKLDLHVIDLIDETKSFIVEDVRSVLAHGGKITIQNYDNMYTNVCGAIEQYAEIKKIHSQAPQGTDDQSGLEDRSL